MLHLKTPNEFLDHIGTCLGRTDWVEITQEKIDAFAALTGDDHWIHVDIDRAHREQPDGQTIAHGLFLLALAPRLQRQLFHIAERGAGLNYGYDKIRFTAPVPSGAKVRLRQDLTGAARRKAQTRIELTSTFEIQGQDRPALVAHGILLLANANPPQAERKPIVEDDSKLDGGRIGSQMHDRR